MVDKFWIDPRAGTPHAGLLRQYLPDGCLEVVMGPELLVLFNTWWYEPVQRDGLTSGILADWIEDHPEAFPNDPRVALLVRWLRDRFAHPDNNWS